MSGTHDRLTPVQPVEKPVICNPYQEPSAYWYYDKETGEASKIDGRRPAGYWYKTDRTGTGQRELFTEEERDDLTLVNRLREDVKRWRESGYRGASNVTRELLRHWSSRALSRPLFFCQREAVETIVYLAEILVPGRSSRTGFKNFDVSDADIRLLLNGAKPSFQLEGETFPTLMDGPSDPTLLPLTRMACKMATGSGKTVVMAMVIAWAFCNRGMNPRSKEFPNAVIVCCPNLTVKERLQVLRPEHPSNYYAAFDIVPAKYRPLMQKGLVLIENWHQFAPESEHKEGDNRYAVVDKGPEDPDSFARRVLRDLYDRMPVMVLNDEGHHCWRPAAVDEQLSGEEERELQREKQEATVWVEGLDRLNNALSRGERGVLFCLDLSATPFYIKGSGHPEGRPYPWIVSDFGLVDAIESGIVKIPRLPVLDTTGRPDPRYFKLWETIREGLEPAEFLPGRARKPKPEIVYREAEGALQQIAAQWRERFEYVHDARPGEDAIPPVLIIVCDNTDIAEVFYRKISGETEIEVVTEADVDEAVLNEGDEDGGAVEPVVRGRKGKKSKTRTVFGRGSVQPELLSNTQTEKRTIRIDTKLLAEAESDDPGKNKRTIAEELRRVVASVGKKGEPGEYVRCVVSVSMLTEGWDANNVTHVLGVRAFRSQLLCEQVVGRGLRRMNYSPDKETGLLPEEYVDVYGIPFSVIPFKGRPVKNIEPGDKPLNHVRAMQERAGFEMRFPVVEGYAFALRKNLIKCDVDAMEPLVIEPNREPTATFLRATVGYQEGHASQKVGPFDFVEQNREAYYRDTHPQAIEFQIARKVLDQLTQNLHAGSDARHRVLRLQSRHQLFPQIFLFVHVYVARKVNLQNAHPCELGLEKYVARMVERLCDAIMPDDSGGEPPLLPILNRYKPVGTTAEVDFKTKRSCHGTQRSHINQVVADTQTWESTAAFKLEQCKAVTFYARNDHLGLLIPYEYQGIDHSYEPDFLVRVAKDATVVLEIKGFEDDQTKAKHNAAKRWVTAVNNWGQLGTWAFHVCHNPQYLEKEIEYVMNQLQTHSLSVS